MGTSPREQKPSKESSTIAASPGIVVRTETTVFECVRLMRTHGIGSVLVVTDDTKEQLVGIFTERDVLNKLELILRNNLWEKPVSTFMTKPVRVLQASMLDQAGETMLKYGFRHLPVVLNDRWNKPHLIGVVSMRNILESTMKLAAGGIERALAPSAQKRFEGSCIGVISTDPYFTEFIEKGLPSSLGVKTRRLAPDNFLDASADMKAVVFDIDHLNTDRWVQTLREVNRRPLAPFTAIVFSPALHNPSTVKILETLGASKRFTVFAKPVVVTNLFNTLLAAL